jgi:GNAT superfamily N-acetyltransferase
METPPEVHQNDPIYLELLSEIHDAAGFSCSAAYLNWYIAYRALEEQASGLSRTIVAVNDSSSAYAIGTKRVEGYLTLEASLMPTDAMPTLEGGSSFTLKRVPVVYLAYLARDKRRRGHGYGGVLLVEAFRRTLLTAEQIGVIGICLYSLSEGIPLYQRFGFSQFTDDEHKMFISVNSIRNIMERIQPKHNEKGRLGS